MPKPYHTPRSERDEAVASLSEAEALEALLQDYSDTYKALTGVRPRGDYARLRALGVNGLHVELVVLRSELVEDEEDPTSGPGWKLTPA
jgi:hypothetical protein